MKNLQKKIFGNRYEVLAEIGKGGMGRVYKVYDPVTAQYFALKELSQAYIDSPAAFLRFKNEFRIMSEFRHPNLVQVFEFGVSAEQIPYIVMELVPGRDLSELPAFTVEQVLDILGQVCQVLSVLHSRLYIHRDLKPGNIKYLEDTSIKLLDYGLMSQLGVPASGKLSGTVYYMAPEVIIGGILDESTDLYSLGIMGYELLTGRLPFTGEKKAILRGHLDQVPPSPASLNPAIPASVNAIIMKLLEKDQDRRYRNSADVLEDFYHLTGRKQPVAATETRKGYLYSHKLVGRTAEIAQFNHALHALRNGRGGALLIGSPAGMGKTRLLHEMKTLAELEGCRTIYLDSQHADAGSYGWLSAFARQLRVFCQDSADDDLQLDSSRSGDDAAASFAARLEEATQDAPLAALFDDAHWMDVQSLNVLNALIRRQTTIKMLLVISFRNDEVEKTSPLWHTIEEELSQYLQLLPLQEQQTRVLIEQLLSPSPISDEFVTYCFQNSGGNVFDLIELLRYLMTEGHVTASGNRWMEPVNLDTLVLPKKLAERVIHRIQKLDDDARTLAGVASVPGDSLDLESWQAVSKYEESRFFQAIEALRQHQIIVKTNGRYMFAHDKIRSALYENLDPSVRAAYHLKTAQFLETKPDADQRELLPALARHFVAAQDAQKAITYSLRAAKAAEQQKADWEAFAYYRDAAHFLEHEPTYPDREALLLDIYERASQFSSAAWIDAATCLRWLQHAIASYTTQHDQDKVFGLSLTYIVTSSISGNYEAARQKIAEVLEVCAVQQGTLTWAILYGAGVCLTDWYQGYQQDCFAHAAAAIDIFEQRLDSLPAEVWSAYSWALFWRDKARAYLGQPVEMANVETIRQLMLDGKSDQTIYWHTLTAVTARAAFTGHWAELLEWKQIASQLSREMGKIYWFECWISHSYLYGAIQHGEFSQLENHIERVQASPDPYQVRLAYLFRGMLQLSRENYQEAERHLKEFLQLEEDSPDNSFLEGFVYLTHTYLAAGMIEQANQVLTRGAALAEHGPRANPLYQLQFTRLRAELAMLEGNYTQADADLVRSRALAETLENPLQMGFIHAAWGQLRVKQHHLPEAERHFEQARDIFLSLQNKYQAGRVVSLLETLAQKKAPKEPQRHLKTEHLTLSSTVVEKEALTQAEIASIESLKIPKYKADTHVRTEVEKTELEHTEIEE